MLPYFVEPGDFYGGSGDDLPFQLVYDGYGLDRILLREEDVGKDLYVYAGFQDERGGWHGAGGFQKAAGEVSPSNYGNNVPSVEDFTFVTSSNPQIDALVYFNPSESSGVSFSGWPNPNWMAGTNIVDVAYTFQDNTEFYAGEILGQDYVSTLQVLNEEQKNAFKAALDSASDATGIVFEEAFVNDALFPDDQAELYVYFADLESFDNAAALQTGAFFYTEDSNGQIRSTDLESFIFIDDGYLNSSFLPGSYEYETLLHEIGHFLGLNHPMKIQF